jgi:cyclic pyranopterin phosphate synthase
VRDPFVIDGHKLHFHPGRVQEWLASGGDWEKARRIFPIYVEVSPTGVCNHRCEFCALDFVGYQARSLDADLLTARLEEMSRLGVKSVMFAGEGEPLLHKRMADIAVGAARAGLDTAFTTNAVLLDERFVERALEGVSWVKASINAGTSATYARIHRCKPEDFEKALGNMARAADFRRRKGLKTALGAQMVLLPENADEARELGRRSKEAGLDYLVVKPYSQHAKSITRKYEELRYERLLALADELEALEGDGFHVVFRKHAMAKYDDPDRLYTTCNAVPHFWAYIMSTGDVYGCSAYLTDERFRYGNINERGFAEIWEGEARARGLRYVLGELDIAECRRNCRMDEVNRYLWALKHPPEHVNFI